jgi:transcriptional regulator with PAS, ATPase and Fis domain
MKLVLSKITVVVELCMRLFQLSKAQKDALAKMETLKIVEALSRFEGNLTRTAKNLGISRACLRNKIQKYSIHWQADQG